MAGNIWHEFQPPQGVNPAESAVYPLPEERGAWEPVINTGVTTHARRCGLAPPCPTADVVPVIVPIRRDVVTGLLSASLAFPGGEVCALGATHADVLYRLADVISERVAAAAAIVPGACNCGAVEGA